MVRTAAFTRTGVGVVVRNQIEIEAEIRQELRHVLRLLPDLRQPVTRFIPFPVGPDKSIRYFVDFQEGVVPTDGNRLKIRTKQLALPDERIQARYYAAAECVWELKDRLARWCKYARREVDIEQYASESQELLICGDLANFKKHGAGRSRTGSQPRLTTIAFDTSRNGVIELYYNGATKEKELWVEHAVQIPFRAPIVDPNDGVLRVDALPVLDASLRHWTQLIQPLGVLDSINPESKVLAGFLFGEGS